MVKKPAYGSTKKQHRIYMAWWRRSNRKSYNSNRLKWANENREIRTTQARSSHLKTKFGLTSDEYLNLVKKQGGRCAICNKVPKVWTDKKGRTPTKLYVDHNHKTGKIRGLLCYNCNFAIGHLKDSVRLLKKTISYLERKS